MSTSHPIALGNILRKLSFYLGLAAFVATVSLPQANAAQHKRHYAKSSKTAVHVKASKTTVQVKRKACQMTK